MRELVSPSEMVILFVQYYVLKLFSNNDVHGVNPNNNLGKGEIDCETSKKTSKRGCHILDCIPAYILNMAITKHTQNFRFLANFNTRRTGDGLGKISSSNGFYLGTRRE